MNLKDKIEKILKQAGVEYRFIPLPEDLAPDVPSHAAFHGIKLANAMATILYKTEKGTIAAVKRSDTQINEEKLKKLAGVTKLSFAPKNDLAKLGTEVGMVPYLGLDVAYFIDKKVLEIDKAYGTAGEKTMGMAMEAKDIPAVNGGTIGDFTDFEKSKYIGVNRRILSGITPSGDGSLHIGNYLGAVAQFIELAKTHEIFLMVADLHALTTVQDGKQLAGNIETLILNELALLKGFLPPEKFNSLTFFRQSDVPAHTELAIILSNITPLGLLKRAHAYKDKLAKDVTEEEVNMGLFNYPILMAADILLYKPELVPVGKDQKQHIEITRDMAGRFNKTFEKKVFPLPEPYIPENVAVVLGTDGKRKMSKSLGNIIGIFESEEIIKKQVMNTYTDPTRIHANDPGHTEGNMVFTYLGFFGEKAKVNQLKEAYIKGQVSDIEVKNYLYESLLKFFAPARKRYEELKKNPDLVKKILDRGREHALDVAGKTIAEVREAVGLKNQYSLVDSSIISINDFSRVEQKVGKVVEAINVEKSDKLIRLVVDFGSEKRIIFTGVRTFGYEPSDFLNKQFFFVTNLAPRKMMNEESQGMILAVDGPDKPIFVSADGMPLGAKIR